MKDVHTVQETQNINWHKNPSNKTKKTTCSQIVRNLRECEIENRK